MFPDIYAAGKCCNNDNNNNQGQKKTGFILFSFFHGPDTVYPLKNARS